MVRMLHRSDISLDILEPKLCAARVMCICEETWMLNYI